MPNRNRLVRFDAEKMAAQGKVAGWQRGEGSDIVANRKFGVEVVHVMWVDEKDNILYDQILRAEPGGGVFLPVDERGRIGLQQQWRPQTNDQKEWSKRFPSMDLREIGRVSYELPRGAAKVGESGESAARREAQEETQSQVTSSRRLGLVCDNTAFSPHFTFVAWGKIDPSRKPADKPDPNEKILKGLEFFSRPELARLQREGKLYDAYTLSALAALYLQHPDLFEKRRRDKESYEHDRRDCGACKGSGKVLDAKGLPMFDADGMPIYCPICGGTGAV